MFNYSQVSQWYLNAEMAKGFSTLDASGVNNGGFRKIVVGVIRQGWILVLQNAT